MLLVSMEHLPSEGIPGVYLNQYIHACKFPGEFVSGEIVPVASLFVWFPAKYCGFVERLVERHILSGLLSRFLLFYP